MKKTIIILLFLILGIFLVSCKNNEPREHNHTYELIKGKESTCKEYGYSDYYKCIQCGDIKDKVDMIELSDHNYQLVKTVDETTTECGYKEYECSECGEKKVEYINALNKEDKNMKGIKILLIGNSITNYNTLKNCFRGIANGEGYDVIVEKCAYGSQYLYDYIQGPDGDHYMDLFQTLFSRRFDLAILQDWESNIILNEGNSFDSYRKLTNYLSKSNVKSMIFESYQTNKGIREIGLNYEESTYVTDGKTQAIASELGIPVSRVAIAFYKVISDKKDIALYNSDGVHPSSYGSYLTALVHTASVFGKRLDGVKYTYNDYIKDKSITWHCENELVEIDSETQKYLEEVANYAAFDFVLDSKYNYSSVGISEEEGTYSGFKKEIEIDKDVLGEINTSYKQSSGTWKVTNNESFINTSNESLLMFQTDLLSLSEKKENVLSFDICVKEELDDCTYARGIVLACSNKDMKYFDGTDALIFGRYSWNNNPHMTSMRVWTPSKFPNYNYKSGYTFDCGFFFKDIDKPVMEVGKTYHIQITIDADKQRYGYYVNGVLYAFVIGYDLDNGGYFGIMSYDSNKIEYSNFKFNGQKLIFN